MGAISHSTARSIDARLQNFGMEILGAFEPIEGEAGSGDKNGARILGLMIASPGRAMWPLFRASWQYSDGKRDPMNHWSGQVLQNIAEEFGARLSMPFDRPYPPFQQWAMRAAHLRQSPLGLLIHPRYGLWFGLRGVLFFESGTDEENIQSLVRGEKSGPDLCQDCAGKPCLSACPVEAFGDWGFDVNACYGHLENIRQTASKPDCMKLGCAARSACPVGVEYQYGPEQLQFHMAAFA